jgi:hypothetical protein
MAPAKQQRGQHPGPVTADEQQLHQLLERLAAAPDLTLFKNKSDRLAELRADNVATSQQALLLSAAALAHGLQLLQPYWGNGSSCSLDLPKKATTCIIQMMMVFMACTRELTSHLTNIVRQQQQQQEQLERQRQQQLVQEVMATGGRGCGNW